MKRIKGINLGSWLLVEGYILGGPNIAETQIKHQFRKKQGKSELEKFENLFRKNFIQKNDFKNIAQTKAKYIRLPFNQKLIEKKPYAYSKTGTQYIKNALDWAAEFKLKIILDLHAACGAQNCDWHGDSDGSAKFWQKKAYRDRAVKLWAYLSDQFNDHSGLGGYDLLNEPVTKKTNTDLIKDYYKKAIAAVKCSDKKNPIFLEGNCWAQQISFLADLISENVKISIHAYSPLSYTYDFVKGLSYPGKIEGQWWNKSTIYKYMKPYADFAKKNKIDILVGEFGINWRGGFWGEKKYLDDLLSVFDDYGFGYTYWTYKAVANSTFPDGLFQYLGNNNYVKREGPAYGWQNYPLYWKKEKSQIKNFWQTKNFTPNKELLAILKTHFVNS
ncbi:MAG: glycoside hydrolase family 5 protein [Candidatus Omnitrophica bacterium]|nr:glycoside hydrolase family 5 protein [Candidatus Omnitrophota bacterium]MCF7891386.1 glycoside hydrolase family 5 protein [Candidatus Omnitrophota bacterium]MCF7896124.1 glycoside hydrolase family 5 protein [Candidatus Omnitrophota bacterium]MCF7897910.1 glycoside hydrolase family 5 protein [Candidatus Omnitrophota bacterium]MCF7909029.1 glycoside hydrolase family 5 protein [Candidatus Omnitrophota bacterium]